MADGRELNAQSNCGWTGLMWAARYGWHHLVQMLIQAGADVAVQDTNGISQQLSAHTAVIQTTATYTYSIKANRLQLVQSAPVSIARLVSVPAAAALIAAPLQLFFVVSTATANVPQVSVCS